MSKRNRPNRFKVKCSECDKEVDSDYQDRHVITNHKGLSVKFTTVVDKGQSKLSFNPPEKRNTCVSADLGSTSSTHGAHSWSPQPSDVVETEFTHSSTNVSLEADSQSLPPIAVSFNVAETELPMSSTDFSLAADSRSPLPIAVSSTDLPLSSRDLSLAADSRSLPPIAVASDVVGTELPLSSMDLLLAVDSQSLPPIAVSSDVVETEMLMSSTDLSLAADSRSRMSIAVSSDDVETEVPQSSIDLTLAEDSQSLPPVAVLSDFAESQSPGSSTDLSPPAHSRSRLSMNDSSDIADFQIPVSSPELSPVTDPHPRSQPTCTDGPLQPQLKSYAPGKFGNETFQRDFQSSWFETHSWLGFSSERLCGYCYACEQYDDSSDEPFEFRNWKKTDRLMKHARSEPHKTAMVKWMSHLAQVKSNVSVLGLMDDNHKRMVARNREYIKVIVECLLFTAQQSIPQRGHEESRQNIDCPSDFNRGNFLELLSLRCKDIPWLADMLNAQLGAHRQWTSPDVQNELLHILSDLTLDLILNDVRSSEYFGIIMDETSDISRAEQVSLCLSYLLGGEKKEAFVGFFKTNSTTGEDLYNLLCEAMKELKLDMKNIVAECFDGASNMCGEYKGVATRMKESSPLSMYIHCYGHLINLALKDTLEEIPVVRNTLGTLQAIYNFLEGSTKRHGKLEEFKDGNEYLLLSLKSQSITRWSCRWEAVKAVYEQLERIIGCLLELSEDKDSKTSSGARSLLISILDFEFIFGLSILRVILMNTSNLNSYVQGTQIDIYALRTTAEMTINTLKGCRNDENAKQIWDLAVGRSKKVKKLIEGNNFFDFADPKVPRLRRIPLRFQAGVDEEVGDDEYIFEEAFDLYRVNTYFAALDLSINELEARFSENDLAILSAMCDVIMSDHPADKSFVDVCSQYDIDYELLKVEHDLYVSFKNNSPDAQLGSPRDILDSMHKHDHLKFLPHFAKVVRIFNVIPATSCAAERSFSALRRLKTYIRSTMGQDRLSHLALLSIERAYSNKIDMDKVIDEFASRKGRGKFFF